MDSHRHYQNYLVSLLKTQISRVCPHILTEQVWREA